MRQQPIVSIVTPSLNQGAFLEETMLSVLENDYAAIEYIVLDGGSRDASVNIIRKYSERLAFWSTGPDKGQADAINRGWTHATGKYVGWLNADDVLQAGAVARLVEYLEKDENYVVAYGDLEDIDEHSRSLGVKEGRPANWRDSIVGLTQAVAQPGSLIRRSILLRSGDLDPKLQFCMDFDLFLRIAAIVGDQGFLYVPGVVAKFRRHQDSKSTTIQEVRAKEIVAIYRRLLNPSTSPSSWQRVRRRSIGNAHRLVADQATSTGEAWRALVMAWIMLAPVPDRDLMKATLRCMGLYEFYREIVGRGGSGW